MGEEAEVNIEMVEASLETIPEVYHRENFDPLKQVNLDRRPALALVVSATAMCFACFD